MVEIKIDGGRVACGKTFEQALRIGTKPGAGLVASARSLIYLDDLP